MSEVRIWDACDRVIQTMNRESLKAFGKLKLARFDEINIVREVLAMYRKLAQMARARYYEEAFEVYLLAMSMCDVEPKKAHKLAEKSITGAWVDEILEQTDYVTLYRFETETERKAVRLAEALGVTEKRAQEIDTALRAWSKQVGQYAINFTDYAMLQAFQDAGIEKVQWMSQKDGRVCADCRALDMRVFPVKEVPSKPHMNCRCMIRPAR